MIKIIPEVKKLEIENKEINIEGIVILGDISAFSKKELENFIAKKTKYKIDSNGSNCFWHKRKCKCRVVSN